MAIPVILDTDIGSDIDDTCVWWRNRCARSGRGDVAQCERESTILFDTVAVYLAFAEELLGMEELGIRVTDDGFTRIDPGAKKIRCATAWRDLDAFEELLVRRLTELDSR